jgi:hypothetical protein
MVYLPVMKFPSILDRSNLQKRAGKGAIFPARTAKPPHALKDDVQKSL